MKYLFTPDVQRILPEWIEQGLSMKEICNRIGCTEQTLRVRCSQYGLSLQRQRRRRGEAVKPEQPRLVVALEAGTAASLQARAKAHGISRERLVASLLKQIATDDLFAAVLDS
jgi:transposase-like protein